MAANDWYVLEEPPYSDGCWRQVLRAAEGDGSSPTAQACAYETLPIDKLAHSGLRSKAPEVFAMIDKMMVGLEPPNTTVAWAVQNAVEDWEKAEIYYLQNYQDRWRTWVTPDTYDKINAALNKSS